MLKLTTDKHEASRGLSVTAELLVSSVSTQQKSSYGIYNYIFQVILHTHTHTHTHIYQMHRMYIVFMVIIWYNNLKN